MRITLCGSARFEREFHDWDEDLTMAGHVVYSLAIYPSSKAGVKDWYDEKQKVTLDLIHLAKIDNSDAVVVINVGGYVGQSTAREVEWARIKGKTIYYVEPVEGAGWTADQLLPGGEAHRR